MEKELKENWYKIEKYYEDTHDYEDYYLRTFENLTYDKEIIEIYKPEILLTLKIIKKDIPVNEKQAEKYLTIHELDPFEIELIFG